MTHPMIADPATQVQLMGPPTFWACEPEWSWQAAPLPHFLLWHVMEGRGRMWLQEQETELSPGFCAVFAPGDEPRAIHDRQHRLLVFGIHFRACDAAGTALAPPEITPPGRWGRLRDPATVTAVAELAERGFDDMWGRRQAELCLTQLLCLLWQDRDTPPPDRVDAALDRLTQIIRREPSRRWRVAELAARVRLSRAQFTRRFTAHTGLPPARYLARARMHRARQLLTDTDLPVSRVAAMLGYSDTAYFGREFKRHTGHSPSAIRRAAQAGTGQATSMTAADSDQPH